MCKLRLPDVTLCAATSVNVRATILALQQCLDKVDFADCLLFTDAKVGPDDWRIRRIPIARLSSGRAYSEFVLSNLVEFVASPYCLVVQWDGFILDPDRWDPEFLRYDYIGAPWPQFADGHDVGNGGFSLRSRRLLQACRDPRFEHAHPEDAAICRLNRGMLEREHGIRFADAATAAQFSIERGSRREKTFGFHGIFNMIPLMGKDDFWTLYRSLDSRTTAMVDYWGLMRQLGAGAKSAHRQAQLTWDKISALVGGSKD